MTGAYQDVIRITKQHNDYSSKSASTQNQNRLSDTSLLTNISALLNKIDTCKVVMINEAHDRVQPRAFILSILTQLKRKGFSHLAMETLSYSDTKNVSLYTGYYTSEPMFGDVVREALKLGFILVPYEDSNAISAGFIVLLLNHFAGRLQFPCIYQIIQLAFNITKGLPVAAVTQFGERVFINNHTHHFLHRRRFGQCSILFIGKLKVSNMKPYASLVQQIAFVQYRGHRILPGIGNILGVRVTYNF